MTTWMLVEDEPDLYDLLTHMIAQSGHHIVGFVDGESALDWVRRVESGTYTGEQPELALIDIRLPGSVDGAQIAAQIRQSPVLKHIALVLMTAYRLSPEQEAALRQAAAPDMLLYKPLPPFDDFRRKLEDLLM